MPVVKKTLETSVDLYKASDIYAPNVSAMLVEKLTERYVGKCYQSMLIQKIDSIIKYSETHMVDNRLDGAAYIDVQFVVEGLILVQGELLHGCKVVDITQSGVIVTHPNAGGLVMADAKKQVIKILKKDQIIPVNIQAARYNLNQPQITIRGTPYAPSIRTSVYYNITDIMSPEETEKLSELMEELSVELSLHAKISSEKTYKFFEELVYPYKTNQKFEMSQLGSKFTKITPDLKSILDIRDGCIIVPEESYKAPGLSIYYSKKPMSQETVQNYGIVIESQIYPAITDCISKRLMYLRNLRGFVEQYNTPEKIQEMMVYWKVCQSVKE